MNRPLVDRTLFPDAPDPAREAQAAQAYANLVHGKRLPTRGPLACTGTSRVPPHALSVIEDYVFRGFSLRDCVPNYITYSGASTVSSQAISQTMARWGSVWFEEEGFVQPWRVYRREGRANLRASGIRVERPPARYPPGTGDLPKTGRQPAGYQPLGGPVSLPQTVSATVPTLAAVSGPSTVSGHATAVSSAIVFGPTMVADPLVDGPDRK
jgi:hypothetical protein